MNRKGFKITQWVSVTFVVLMVMPSAVFAGLKQPPLSIIGRLETPGGQPLTTGDLVFTLTQPNQRSIVSKKAKVSRMANGLTFTVSFDVEQTPVSNPNRVVKFQTVYLPSATYNGEPLNLTSFPETVTPGVGTVVGPVTLSATPDGPVLVLSEDLVFGAQKIDTSQLRQLFVRNVGTQTLIGTARMKTGSYFRIVEQGVAINQAEIELAPDETHTLDIRFWPTLLSGGLFDEVILETNAGSDKRNVSGQSLVDAPEVTPTETGTPTATLTPTVTPTPTFLETSTPTPTFRYDISPGKRDGRVNPEDLLLLLHLKETAPSLFPEHVLFDFAREWKP